jgi:pimeloyl-ACP methyl ester carboxylesterase
MMKVVPLKSRIAVGDSEQPAYRIYRREYPGGDGLKIVADVGGPLSAPTVILGHGGGQTRHSWAGAAERLMTEGFRVINHDLRGHGESEWSRSGKYSADDRAADLLSIMDRISGPVALVGASMGGISALYAAAVADREDLRAVVLVDIVPRPDPAGVAHVRDFMQRHVDGFASLEEVADAVQAYNPNRRRPSDLNGLRRNLRSRNGRLYWHWDPAILRLDATGEHAILAGALSGREGKIRCPVLLVRGLNSDVVSQDGITELRDWLPQTEVFDVAGAGHMVVGDRNDEFNAGVVAFLNRHGRLRMPIDSRG